MRSEDAFFSFADAHERALEAGSGPDEALGAGMEADFSSRTVAVDVADFIVGASGSSSLVTLTHKGLCCTEQVPGQLSGTGDELRAKELIETWRPRTTAARFSAAKQRHFCGRELDALENRAYGWAGGWGGHAVLGYERVLREGIEGVASWVRRCSEEAGGAAEPAAGEGPSPERDWYRGLLRVCSGIRAFIENHALAASKASARSTSEAETRRRIASACRRVSRFGARDLHEAVQLFWFIHVLDETDSPGRIDQFLHPYYMLLSPDPAERRRLAYPILDSLWKQFIRHRTWNVCLAGQTASGADAANELTEIFLGLQERHGREAPNLSVRFHRAADPGLLSRCTEVISNGSGQPALYNDEVIVPALMDLGIPAEHARTYAMNGCAQIDIPGMSHMGLEDGEISLAKCLELALHSGRCAVTGRRIGASTLPVEGIDSFETLRRQVELQIEYAAELFTRASNVFQQVQADSCPQLLRSLFVESCVARGRDLKRGGPLYNHGQFQTEGVANCGDSLYTVRRLVFEERRMGLSRLVEILDSDWRGHEALRNEVVNGFPKYGNGVTDVDTLVAGMLDHYFTFLKTRRTWRGGRYAGGVVVFNRAIGYGKGLAASADGRRSGTPVSDSVGPSQGFDRHGPTAMLSSVAQLPMSKAACAVCLNLRLEPSLFKDRSGSQAVRHMFETYFRMGGQQLQVNVLDQKTLLAAQKAPHQYRSLIVRVGGYSDRFVALSKEQQNDVLNRTAHAVL